MASWSSGNAFVFGAGGLKFKPWTGHIGHAVLLMARHCYISSKVAVFARVPRQENGPRKLVKRLGVIPRVL